MIVPKWNRCWSGSVAAGASVNESFGSTDCSHASGLVMVTPVMCAVHIVSDEPARC
jgi:hypothetical protein